MFTVAGEDEEVSVFSAGAREGRAETGRRRSVESVDGEERCERGG